MCGGGQQTSTTTPYGDAVKYDAQGKMIPGTGSGQRKFMDIGQQYAFENLKVGMPDMFKDPLTAPRDSATAAAERSMLDVAGGAQTTGGIEGAYGAIAQQLADAEAAKATGASYGTGIANEAARARMAGERAAGLGLTAQKAVDPYATQTMGYGAGAAGDLSETDWANIMPFEDKAAYQRLLSGELDTGYLEPAIEAAGAQLGRSFTRDIAPAIRTGTINTGQGRGYGTREAVIAGMEGSKMRDRMDEFAKSLYTPAITTALSQRLPAAQQGLTAQADRIGTGFRGGELGLGGTRLALTGEEMAQRGAGVAGQLTGQAAGVEADAYRTALAQQEAARSGLTGITGLRMGLTDQVSKIGAGRQQQAQAEIAEAVQRDSWAKMKERQGLENYMRLVSGTYGGQSTIPGATALQQAGQGAELAVALKALLG